ncbi:hypothetical protein [Actinomadura rudentiformis]|uniref:Uncharacterized protein n=1 Tax=Actinomadura rudentiformis TaxID=359158 RepID=A0A6H9YSM6_9ACTN|nr:hypothetical protein [Actinomadura rudentiformis]KAB2344899.1 hypothetical protein F8566_30380 [Actinomadura rudentiformis]
MPSRSRLPMEETQRKRRGHEFLPPPRVIDRTPGERGQENVPEADKIAHIHYFGGAVDFWVTEMWQEIGTGEWMAFGYMKFSHAPNDGEWGSQYLSALEQMVLGRDLPYIVERDLYWDPTPMWQIERAGVWDSHGYQYIVRYGEMRGWPTPKIAELCRKAHQDQAPADTAMWDGTEWWTASEAPLEIRERLGVPSHVDADDVDLDELGYPYLVQHLKHIGHPPAYIARICRKAAAVNAPPDTYLLEFPHHTVRTVGEVLELLQNVGYHAEPPSV